MIESELVLLGLLKEGRRHGYEIKKEIKEILSLFAGINPKSIYYPLRVLESKGLVVKCIERRGKRPARYVYTLTPKGQARFNALLNKSFLDFKRPQFSLDLSLYFLHYIKPRFARRRLRGRMLILKKLSKDLKQVIRAFKNKKSPSLRRISEHNLKMIDSESQFISSLIKEPKIAK